MAKISVRCSKAKYVAEHCDQYFNIFNDALCEFLQSGASFTKDDLSSSQKIINALKSIIFCYIMCNPNHYELKASLKSKRAIMRINNALPKGTKIPFELLVAMEKLQGYQF